MMKICSYICVISILLLAILAFSLKLAGNEAVKLLGKGECSDAVSKWENVACFRQHAVQLLSLSACHVFLPCHVDFVGPFGSLKGT